MDVLWNHHRNDLGDWCPWSGQVADDGSAADEQSTCPARCEDARAEEETRY